MHWRSLRLQKRRSSIKSWRSHWSRLNGESSLWGFCIWEGTRKMNPHKRRMTAQAPHSDRWQNPFSGHLKQCQPQVDSQALMLLHTRGWPEMNTTTWDSLQIERQLFWHQWCLCHVRIRSRIWNFYKLRLAQLDLQCRKLQANSRLSLLHIQPLARMEKFQSFLTKMIENNQGRRTSVTMNPFK